MNREIYPGGAYPLTGDVSSSVGNQGVTVVGIQKIAVADTFLDGGEVLQYNINTHQWEPTLRAAIQIDNVSVSDDYIMTVNVPKMALINGS